MSKKVGALKRDARLRSSPRDQRQHAEMRAASGTNITHPFLTPTRSLITHPKVASSTQTRVTHPDLRYNHAFNIGLQHRECRASPGKQAHTDPDAPVQTGGSDHSHFNENCWDSRLAGVHIARGASSGFIKLARSDLFASDQFAPSLPAPAFVCTFLSSPYPCSNRQHLLTHPS